MDERPISQPRAIPPTVWALGLVSMFMDISSEMIHGLLPLFVTGVLGASVTMLGLIDGLAEATASISKIFSGYISDRIGKRRPLILLGYGLGAASKPLFALAMSPMPVLGARFIDRIGKGMRGAPRDALVADITPLADRGRAYGLRQTLDTVGAFLGPLLAIALLALFAGNIRLVFWCAVVPGAIAVALVVFGVRDPPSAPAARKVRFPLRVDELRKMPSGFWAITAIGVVITMARFSEAFLILKASGEGLPLALTPLVLVVMSLVYSLGAYPAGIISDRSGPHRLLLLGLGCLIGADLLLAMGHGLAMTFAGIGLWGAHMALSQGLLAQLVAQHAPHDRRGSAFGLFNLVTGVTMLVTSLLAGLLWDRSGPASTFLAGAGFALLAGLMLVALRAAIRPGATRQA